MMVLLALAAFIVLTLPVSLEYFFATIGNKYLLLTIDKTNTVRLKAAKFKNGTATIDKGTAKFIKTDLDGSMSIGNCRCDIVHKDISVMAQVKVLGAIDQLNNLGIDGVQDLCNRINYVTMVDAGLIGRPKTEAEDAYYQRQRLIKDQLENKLSILKPAITPIKLKNMVQYGVITPQMLKADEEENTIIIAKHYNELLGGKKGSDAYGALIPLVIVLGVIIMGVIAVLAYTKTM